MILLARHGQTAHNAEGRFQGQGDVPLDATGRQQAAQLAELAAAEGTLRALYASPIARACETAEIIAARIGLEPIYDARFAEHDVGAWAGRLFADIEREEPEAWAAWRQGGEDWRFPGGESLLEQQERVIAGLVDVTQRNVLPALVVCHRGVIRSALCHTRNDGLDGFHRVDVPNGSLVRL